MSCLEVGYLLREIIRLRRLIAPPKGLAIPSYAKRAQSEEILEITQRLEGGELWR